MFESDLKALRLARDCSQEEVRRAYVRLTRRYPPEHFPERFKRIKQAFERLSLDPSHLQAAAVSIAQAESPLDVMDIMIEEALELAQTKSSEQDLPQPDVRELEPVLNAEGYREELFSVLQRIAEEGVAYKGGSASNEGSSQG
jgi:hypothetical protein